MRLLVAAVADELDAFPTEIAGFDRLVTGPGKLKAAVGLSEALLRGGSDGLPYEQIVVVGTSGLVDDALAGDVHDVAVALQHDVTDLEGVRGRHVTLPERVAISAAPAGSNVTVATGDSFVDDAEVAAFIRSTGAALVDMETYAYAWVAARNDVPIRVIRAVSDRAQDGATKLWDEIVTVCSAWLWDRFRAEYVD